MSALGRFFAAFALLFVRISRRIVLIRAGNRARSAQTQLKNRLQSTHVHTLYGCAVTDYLAPMYRDIAEAEAVVVASPVYFYQVTGQTKLWLDRMFPMIDGEFRPRQPGKKSVTIFSQAQDDPDAFKAGSMDWLNNILKGGFGWEVTASIVCCGEPAEVSAEYTDLMQRAYGAGSKL